MASMRGERFHIDLDDQAIDPNPNPSESNVNSGNLVGNIVERTPSIPKPPSAPMPSTSGEVSGWPAHRKRYQGAVKSEISDQPLLLQRHQSFSIEDTSFDALQRQEIDLENRRRISEMSLDEIESERKELFENLNPALITRLLSRSSIESDATEGASNAIDDTSSEEPRKLSASGRKVSFAIPEDDKDDQKPVKASAESHSIPLSEPLTTIDNELPFQPSTPRRLSNSGRKVSFATPQNDEKGDKTTAASHSIPPTPPLTPANPSTEPGIANQPSPRRFLSSSSRKVSFADPEDKAEEDKSTAERHSLPPTPNLVPLSESSLELPESVHFPKPPTVPELDPNSESFLDDLHTKYFPNLAHDPSKLEWMKPSTQEENTSYNPSQPLHPSTARFSFKGKLISPEMGISLPTNVGLHHHGDAPDSAGYTISELGTLARSAFPAQRCLAIQTIGRILYRLGIGEFDDQSKVSESNPPNGKSLFANGLWAEVDKTRVIDTLTEWANKTSGHRTSIALAQEAVWNWQQGGGRTMQSV